MKVGDRVRYSDGEGVVIAVERDEWGQYVSLDCGDFYENVDVDECRVLRARFSE